MTLDELLVLCAEHGVDGDDLILVLVHPLAGESPMKVIRSVKKCHLCLSGKRLEPGENGLWWCRDVRTCNYRARHRLGISHKRAKQGGHRPGVITAP
jgi:hypothetical protein